MLTKEDKDGIIAFLKHRLQEIENIANEHCICNPYNKTDVAFSKISDIARRANFETTW